MRPKKLAFWNDPNISKNLQKLHKCRSLAICIPLYGIRDSSAFVLMVPLMVGPLNDIQWMLKLSLASKIEQIEFLLRNLVFKPICFNINEFSHGIFFVLSTLMGSTMMQAGRNEEKEEILYEMKMIYWSLEISSSKNRSNDVFSILDSPMNYFMVRIYWILYWFWF